MPINTGGTASSGTKKSGGFGGPTTGASSVGGNFGGVTSNSGKGPTGSTASGGYSGGGSKGGGGNYGGGGKMGSTSSQSGGMGGNKGSQGGGNFGRGDTPSSGQPSFGRISAPGPVQTSFSSNMRGPLGPGGELRTGITPSTRNYQNAEIARTTRPDVFGKYTQQQVTDYMNHLAQVAAPEAYSARYGMAPITDIANVALNQVGYAHWDPKHYDRRAPLAGTALGAGLAMLDSSRARKGTYGLPTQGLAAPGTPTYNTTQGMIQNALLGRGITPGFENATNFTATGTGLKGTKVIGNQYGTSYRTDPGTAPGVKSTRQQAANIIGGGMPTTQFASADTIEPASYTAPPTPRAKPDIRGLTMGMPREKPDIRGMTVGIPREKPSLPAAFSGPSVLTGGIPRAKPASPALRNVMASAFSTAHPMTLSFGGPLGSLGRSRRGRDRVRIF